MPEPETLVARQVTAGYGGPPALRGVDLAVGPGEVVGFIGPNGSGKTTFVRVASRALRPSAGRVSVGGREPFAVSARRWARLVAVVPQELGPTFPFTVVEMVLMGRSAYLSPWGGGRPEDHRRAREAMDAAGVHHLADRDVDRLSGGEKQRVILAQALAQDAPVLLLDEPTTHLDPGHVVAILETVRRLARERGVAVLAVFHDLNLASASCDRLVALDRGRVVAEGIPEEVISGAFVREIYGVEADVFPHFATGRPVVVLGPALEPTPSLGPTRAHVVGGAGRGAPVMRSLSEAGFQVTAGVIHAADTDALVAERLDLERVTVPPFSHVDEEAQATALEMMRRASVVVVCDAPFGPGNVDNLRIALAAIQEGADVVLLDQVPMRERDFTGGEATRLWEELAGAARRARSYEEVAALVR